MALERLNIRFGTQVGGCSEPDRNGKMSCLRQIKCSSPKDVKSADCWNGFAKKMGRNRVRSG